MTDKIEFNVRKNLMYVHIPVWCKPENRYRDACMLIDTGASVTAFSSAALKKLGCYNEHKKATVRTASDFVDVYVVRIPKMQIASFELTDVEVHAHASLDEFHCDGIIGMNILTAFDFSVTFADKTLTLTKR